MMTRPLGIPRNQRGRVLPAIALGLAAALTLGACGGSDEGSERGEGEATTETRNASQAREQAERSSGEERSERNPGGDSESAHFERIRKADPCELGETDFLKQFGSEQMVVPGNSITECRLVSRDPGEDADVYTFTLQLHSTFSESDAEGAVSESTIAGHRALVEEYSTDSASHRSCHYKLPYEGQESALYLSAVRTPPYGQENEPWQKACEVAERYLGEVAGRAMSLPPAEQRDPDGLTGHDPCAREDELVAALPEYELDERIAIGPYACQLTLSNQAKNQELTVDVSFAFHERQQPQNSEEADITGERISMAGLYGVRHEDDTHVTKTCGNAIEVRKAMNLADDDAHYLSVSVSSSKLEVKHEDGSMEAPAVSCDVTDELTGIVLSDVRS